MPHRAVRPIAALLTGACCVLAAVAGRADVPLPPTGVVWHFILPQNDRSLYAPNPDNIFVSLTVRFAAAGEVTLTTFGPPSGAHGWIATPTDDVLLDGFADGAERNGDGFPPLFNLSHTCAAPGVVPPTTTTTTSTTRRGGSHALFPTQRPA